MKNMPPVLVLTTGGTIDKQYFDALSRHEIADTMVTRLLEIGVVTYPYRIEEVLRKDSLEMTDEDRARIADHVRAAGADRLVISHGTDTMTRTATVLSTIEGKTIVLTGALTPARFAESDAAFNLGMAFAAAQIAPPGVYIAINGCIFRADEATKDRERGCFVRKREAAQS